MVRAGIYGASGYSGYETMKILLRHPQVEVRFATSESYSGQKLSEVFATACDFPLVHAAEAKAAEVDVVFVCLPDGPAMRLVKEIWPLDLKIVDLSADFRLNTPESYKRWYKEEHVAPELLPQAVYGLPELYRERIRGARLIANPGCYPTAALLALYPLAKEGCLAERPIIVDAKSGISGAGRSPSPRNLFVEVNENVVPYSIGHAHRHVPEMEQELAKVMGRPCQMIFTPQLVPLNQGILSTIYVELAEPLPEKEVQALYRECYRDEPFVIFLEGKPAHLKYAFANNYCAIGLTPADGEGRHYVLTSAIDNLIKGAAGQAVQNMNLMFGLPEDMGLR